MLEASGKRPPMPTIAMSSFSFLAVKLGAIGPTGKTRCSGGASSTITW
jgi:hypothetical protein